MGRRLMLLLVVILVRNNNVSAQTIADAYWKIIHSADSLYQSKKYCKAAAFYSRAFNNKNGYSADINHLSAAFCWAKCGNVDSSLTQLYRLVYAFDFTNYTEIEEMIGHTIVGKHAEYKKIINYCKCREIVNKRKFLDTIAHILDSIYVVDQAERTGDTINGIKVIVTEKSQQSNMKVIDSIYKNYGWLSSSQVGIKAALGQFLVIQHDSLHTMIKWKPIIKNALDSCLLSPECYALLTDRILVWSGKKQVYGTQPRFDQKRKKYVPFPIENPSGVNARRMRLGMIKLELDTAVINTRTK